MNKLVLAFGLVVVCQIAVLAGMVASASMPLLTGQEVKLAVIPVDPRSLFRGNYAELNYEISTVPSRSLPNLHNLRHGEIVYVSLDVKNGVAEMSGVSLTKPDDKIFIRGRLQYPNENSDTQQLLFGIEALFAPREKALLLEKQLIKGAMAEVMLASSGRAALKNVCAELDRLVSNC